MSRTYCGLWTLLSCLLLTGEIFAGPQVAVVVGSAAPELERFAARELASQLTRLFEAEVTIGEKIPDGAAHVVLIGSPATNSSVKSSGIEWPKLTDQGHLLRSVKISDKTALVAGGGSPVATLWAVYELGHHFGIRYALYGDMYPADTPPLKLDGIDIQLEPALRTRSWRTIDDFAIGSESWGLAEHELVIQQLAKNKFNQLTLVFHPWQPFVDFEFQGVKKETGVLWYGHQYPINGDTAGRAVFRGAKLFENPDFAGKKTYSERIAAGTQQARGIISAARKLGMSTSIAFSPLEFPKEFKKVLPGAEVLPGLEPLAIGPGTAARADDSPLMQLAKAQLRAYVLTYPDVDAVCLELGNQPEWSKQAEVAWKELDAKYGVGDLKKLTPAENNRLPALHASVTALEFASRLLADKDLAQRPRGTAVKFVVADVDPALLPLIPKLLPAGTEALHSIASSAVRAAEQRTAFKAISAKSVPSSLVLTLSDEHLGVLPQMSFSSLKILFDELRANGWDGFAVRSRNVGDIDFSTYYLSRASFQPELTPSQALESLATAALGAGTAVRTLEAFEFTEKATALIDAHDLDFGAPQPDMILKYLASSEPAPEWWGQAKGMYLHGMDEMYRVNSRARDGNRRFSLYIARRLEFGAEYLSCLEATKRAGIAKAKGDNETRIAELEKAVESLHSALNALGAITRSNSDRGIIAVLNEYGYRPLQKELEAE